MDLGSHHDYQEGKKRKKKRNTYAAKSFTATIPARIAFVAYARLPRAADEDVGPKTLAPRPYSVLLAISTASVTSVARIKTHTGPNSSSCAMRIEGVTSTSRVGEK